jgi:HAD superfamily phosphoserine phosphatase-like hydrolase
MSDWDAESVSRGRTKLQSDPVHFAFDLDGTVSRVELVPLIARLAGKEQEIAELTERTISGALPFEESLRHRVDLLKEVPIAEVVDLLRLELLDAAIVSFILAHKDRCVLVTGNLDVWISPLSQALGCRAACSKARVKGEFVDGIVDVLDKGVWGQNFPYRYVGIGDGHNDLGLLQHAEIAIAYGGVHPPARSLLNVADYVFYDGSRLCDFLRAL